MSRRRKIGIDVEAGPALVGSIVRIFWDGDRKFYQGKISAFNPATWKHTVRVVRGDPSCFIDKILHNFLSYHAD